MGKFQGSIGSFSKISSIVIIFESGVSIMTYRKLRLGEIAKGADVSIATASRYLNGIKVRASSAVRIEKYLRQQLLKDPSVVFHNKNTLIAGQVIGLIIPTLSSFYFTETLTGVLNAAKELGYSVVTAMAQLDIENERQLLEDFSRYNLAGLIYAPVALMNDQIPVEIEALKHIPIVVANRRNILPGRIHVYADNINAGYLATRHLLSRGRKNIGFALGTWNNNSFDIAKLMELSKDYDTLGGFPSVDRFRGYIMALEEHDLPFSPSLLSVTSWDSEGGVRSVAELIGKAPHMDGLIATSDLLSAAALRTLQKHGYKIPQDIAVIGWNNSELASYTAPTLTSIVNPAYEIGYSAVSVINRLLRGEQVQDIVLASSIVARESTAITR